MFTHLSQLFVRVLMRVTISTGAVGIAAVVAVPAQAQTAHAVHAIPDVGAELLNRPLPLRTGIGQAHDKVGTTSADAQAYYDQGLAYLHAYVWIEAGRSFNQALRLDPRLAIAHAGLSLVHTELNQPALAAAALARARELASSVPVHDRRHIEARIAQAAAEASASPAALLAAYRQRLDAALVAEPGDAELWLLRGLAESPDPSERGQGGVVSAIPFYEKALALGAVSAQHYLTHAFENANRNDQALAAAAAWARAASRIPHALHMHGHVLRRLGRIDAAVAEFEAADRLEREYLATEKVPAGQEWHDEHNLDLLASSYQYLGQMDKAEARLRAAFELPSGLLVQMYSKRAWPEFLIARGRFDEADRAAAVLIEHPSGLVKATGYAESGLARLAAGRVSDATERFNQALRQLRAAPGGQGLVSPALEQLQGGLFLRRGPRERGETVLKALAARARALPGPDNWVRALFTLEAIGRMARDAGDWELASWAADQMMAHDSRYAGSHYAAGLAAERAGQADVARREFDLARSYWQRADPSARALIQGRGATP